MIFRRRIEGTETFNACSYRSLCAVSLSICLFSTLAWPAVGSTGVAGKRSPSSGSQKRSLAATTSDGKKETPSATDASATTPATDDLAPKPSSSEAGASATPLKLPPVSSPLETPSSSDSKPADDATSPDGTPKAEPKAETEKKEKKSSSRSRRSREKTETRAIEKTETKEAEKTETTEAAAEAPKEKKTTSRRSSRSKSKSKETDTTGGEAKPAEPPTVTEQQGGDAKKTEDVKPKEETKPETAGESGGETQTKTETTPSKPESETTTTQETPKKETKDAEETAAESDEIAPPRKKSKNVGSLGEADELLLKNKFEEAEDAYRGLIGQDDSGDAYAGLAVALAKQNDTAPKKVLEAEKIMKKGFEQFNDNPNVQAAGAFVSYMHSKSVASPARRDKYLDAAETLAKRAIKSSPDTVIAQQTLGLVKLAQDDPEGAIAPLKKAARMAEDAYTNTLLAEAMLKVDPHDSAAKALIDEALSLNSKYHPARLQKAFYLTNKGKHEEAYTELHTIPKDQRNSDWHKVQGDIYKAQGDGPSALASWKEANRLDPRNPEPYKNLARYYSQRGDGELGIAEMHNALEILPNDLAMRAELAELALRQDKLDVAETEYRTILSAKEGDPSSLLGLSRVFFRKARKEGQYPPGYAELMDQISRVVTEQSVQGQLIRKGAKNLGEKVQLSEAEKALADSPPRFREARQLFSQVIASHKEEPYELLSLGDQAYNDGDLKSAEEAFVYAKEIPEVAPRAEQGISKIVNQRNEAKRYVKLGDATWKLPDVAIDNYKQALIADPQDPNAYYGLYKLYFRLKMDDKKAIDYAHTFLEASDDSDPLRKEVEDDLSKLKRRVQK